MYHSGDRVLRLNSNAIVCTIGRLTGRVKVNELFVDCHLQLEAAA